MKNWKFILTLALCTSLVFGFISCSSGGDDNGALLAVTSGGGSGGTDNGTQPGGGTNPTLAATYTVTFNANDGSQNPATVTQNFTAGIAQALIPVEELGFSKEGFSFAGWGRAPKSKQSSYADGASYTATANETLYALWSEIPIYSVNIPVNQNGSITASPATATAGTEIMLSNTPKAGYKFTSYSVIDADGEALSVTDGKFTMPAKDVTVNVVFTAINYNINVAASSNGRVTASPTTATVGTSVTLTASPASGYRFSTLIVTDSDGIRVVVSGTGNSRAFIMPAKNVTVTATFSAIHYAVNVGTFANGSVTATPSTATVGTVVALTATPSHGNELATLTVVSDGGASVVLEGTGNSRTFTMPANNVTVTAVFVVAAASGAYTRINTIKRYDTQYDLVTFGLWPQTIKAANVEISEQCESKTVGEFTYYKGSDGQWYAKVKENAYESGCIYSDGSSVAQSSANSYKWFKVEPIKWRVLTESYNGTDKKLLLAQNILITKRYAATKSNYQNSEIRKWLNSNTYSNAASDHGDSGGFLKTVFAATELSSIVDMSVDNSARSTNPDTDATYWNSGNNQNASDTHTIDKVFLLSEQEVTKREYGFDACDTTDGFRVRYMTDYAKACGAVQTAYLNMGNEWWLRSPFHVDSTIHEVHHVTDNGYALYRSAVRNVFVGVVPALCVSN